MREINSDWKAFTLIRRLRKNIDLVILSRSFSLPKKVFSFVSVPVFIFTAVFYNIGRLLLVALTFYKPFQSLPPPVSIKPYFYQRVPRKTQYASDPFPRKGDAEGDPAIFLLRSYCRLYTYCLSSS